MTDMSAVVWALVGLLAAALGILSTALFAAIGRIDDLRAHMEAKFDRVDSRFDRLEARFDRLHDDVRQLRETIVALDGRLTVAGG
jgi:outer membrane murein-binding lipoprotein Lpp